MLPVPRTTTTTRLPARGLHDYTAELNSRRFCLAGTHRDEQGDFGHAYTDTFECPLLLRNR